VEAYANVYSSQDRDRKLVNYTNALLETQSPAGFDTPGLKPLRVMTGSVPNGERWVVAYAYNINGRVIGNDTLAQLYYGLRATFANIPAGMVALATPCGADCAHAAEALTAIWQHAGSRLASVVPQRARSGVTGSVVGATD
jgi:hypothetical protein